MDHDQAIEEFISSAGGTREIAEQYLEMTDWNVQPAVQAFIMDNEEEDDDGDDETTADTSGPAQASGTRLMGGRRLGDDSDPVPSAQSSASVPSKPSQTTRQPKKMFGSLSDLQSGGQSGSHGHDDDDSDKEQEFFTGGDKSGLAVQDPRSRDHIQRLMDTARRNGPPPPREDGQDGQPSETAFSGAGQTLGGDDVESQPVPAQNPQGSSRPPPMVERTLHMWADGFSVDDGPLYRYDDPANARTLDMINSGSAPLAIMNVEPGQAVDVKLDAHRGENYVQPKRKYKPFSGGGNRLGSPVPGASGTAEASSTAAPAQPQQSESRPAVEIDDSLPMVTLQIRLADGTRLPSRFNTTHTIGDVYSFVDRASSGSSGRAYTLATTFPTKELVDKDQVLGDMAEFKRGGVVVQKWS